MTNLNVQHLDYSRVGRERFGDLIVICRDCHELLQAGIDRIAARTGKSRRVVMDRLRPYCVRRLAQIHDIYRQHR